MKTASKAKQALARVPAPEPVDQVLTEEVTLAQQAGTVIAGWLGQARQFLTTARDYEKQAVALYQEMQKTPVPATAAADEALQLKVKQANVGAKSAEAHWYQITSVVHQFHRRLTGRRDQAVKHFNDAASLGNRHHKTFVDAAVRAAAEKDRQEREARERQAQKDREAELAALELQALKAEQDVEDLSERETIFVLKYVNWSGPAVDELRRAMTAASAAGYRDPRAQAERLLNTAKIVKAIDARRQADAIRQQATAKAEQPLDVAHETVRPDVTKAAGTTTRRTWKATLLDEAALIAAVLKGDVPEDVLEPRKVNRTRLNEYARDLKQQLNRWPGVEAYEDSRII